MSSPSSVRARAGERQIVTGLLYMTRYDGKPFLRVAECWVLWSIAELDPEQESTLERMTPKLQETLGQSGEWYEIVEAEIGVDSTARAEIQRLWQTSLANAASNGNHLEPQHFAEMFIDSNFG